MVPVPTGKWENIFQPGKSQGILSRLEKSGNFTQNPGKLKIFTQNTGKIVNFTQFFFFCDLNFAKFLCVNFNWSLKNRTQILENEKKYWNSQRNLSVRLCGDHDFLKQIWLTNKFSSRLYLQVKGLSDRPGPQMCPRIEASFTEILVPSGQKKKVTVKALNLQVRMRSHHAKAKNVFTLIFSLALVWIFPLKWM